jgi:hypothetical protein
MNNGRNLFYKSKCRRFLFLVFAGRTGQGGEEGGGEKGRGSRGRDRVHRAPTIRDSLICNRKHKLMSPFIPLIQKEVSEWEQQTPD